MTDSPLRQPRDLCLLVLAPTERDAALTAGILGQAGVACVTCSSVAEAARELEAGAGALLVAEEAIASDENGALRDWLARQPPWSDLPVLILALSGADSPVLASALDTLRNVSVLERPIRLATLTSAVHSALRARLRQYQIRDYLAQRDADLRRKDEFLAILAHELRNPLAPIRNSLYLLRLSQERDPHLRRIVDVVERQVGHLIRLVDDLLEISRITRGKFELRNERLRIADIVRSAVETSRPLIDASNHELTIAVPEEPLTVHGDPVRLTQVIANLLNNAAKYTDSHGRIWLTVSRDGNEAVISVRDNGAGIEPALLSQAFELFTQISPRAGRERDGLGIGLTLVKSLVEMHGGTVVAHSKGLGHGSEFTVRLPLARASIDVPDATAPRDPFRPLPGRRVLVVDDNRDAAESLAMLLKLLGADVSVAYSGPEALTAMSRYRPRAVLLDIGMPGMDGHEVARKIRERDAADAVTLIALTGWGQDEDRHLSRAAGFDHHLVKPVDLNALESLLLSLDSDQPDLEIDAQSVGPESEV